jgi:hypothetical protein
MHNEQQNSLYAAIVGDWNIHIIETGLSHDADTLIVGWLHAWKPATDDPARVTGIMWDSARIIVDCSQPLQAREVDALIEAGFIVDDTFKP